MLSLPVYRYYYGRNLKEFHQSKYVSEAYMVIEFKEGSDLRDRVMRVVNIDIKLILTHITPPVGPFTCPGHRGCGLYWEKNVTMS